MGEYFVPSKSCQDASSYEVIEFQSKNKNDSAPTEKPHEVVDELDMKKVRFEVYKFAQSGLSNVERQKSQFDLALKLGAVPRKNKAINYKTLKEERKTLKKAENDKLTLLEKNIKRKPKQNKTDPKIKLRKKRKVGSGILKGYGQVKRK